MAFEALAEAAERWCARTPFQLIAAEETERRMDFYAEPGVSFYVLCPEAACGDNFAEPWIAQVFSLCSIILFSATAGTSLLETEMWRLQNEKDFVKNMVGWSCLYVCRTARPMAAKWHGHVWSESEDCLPFLQLAQDYISSCGKKTLHEILEKVFKSFRPLLGLLDVEDDAFEEYSADMEDEAPEADHQ
uniref:Maturin n=1 Tax=Coturnix japonica TaxID=93934 RepID=A0A8C2TPL8_COTJA